ncbi:relaxase/mobilization nuclease domain-containing protein [Pseudomonas plecoglossicida]|uniref:Relaxase/mobilization nuclease domain-containing protein n=1 Tax=Pseudomonas putida TaxID=303 RepID=A0A7Z9EPS9_PSEPU|nr:MULTISPECIES: relaxase/mobilization nuclease domain-containing protein [Pseudomonas]KAF0256045.1 relaxase/mobilization nuclease domain-containing protein [Pseudomonas putida]MCK2124090.1 relaxase/mobilization nuclease domain-containing protein [Pseudomonas sp. PNPG3]MDQ7962730.1 relaxase/mobilization nuclease domain-containing protein [Pseudomonas plecoglossicida]WFG05272.1 relaxase/mobilization nuclease domain-containing protein [Pseudomonas putida]
MIGKIFPKSAGSFKGRIRYIFGCTKHDHEISGIRTISHNTMSRDPLPAVLQGDESDVLEMIREFDQVENLRRLSIDSDKPIKPVFHAMLSLRPGESLTTSQWRTAVETYLDDLGFDETNQFVAVMHQDKDHQHVHIVANRIRLNDDFSMVKDSNERSVSLDSVSKIEDRFNLSKAPKPKDTWGVSITHAELQASIRDGDLPLKHKMIAKIAGAIEATTAQDGDMFDFVRALRKQKVYIHLALNDEGQPKGISFEFDGKHISGRQLKRSRLTWHKLTTQEGIKYDPETIHQLQVEIARRDSEEQERLRVYYYEFVPVSGRRKKPLYIKFTGRDYQLQKLIKEILELIDALFDAIFKPRECRLKVRYIEYIPGQPLEFEEEQDLELH